MGLVVGWVIGGSFGQASHRIGAQNRHGHVLQKGQSCLACSVAYQLRSCHCVQIAKIRGEGAQVVRWV